MDFGGSLPEINCGRTYSGLGCGSMPAAAAAWGGLSADAGPTPDAFRSASAALATHPGEVARRVMTSHPAPVNAGSAVGERRASAVDDVPDPHWRDAARGRGDRNRAHR